MWDSLLHLSLHYYSEVLSYDFLRPLPTFALSPSLVASFSIHFLQKVLGVSDSTAPLFPQLEREMSSGAPEGLPPGMSPEEAQAMQQALDAELTRITTIAQIYYAAVIAVVIWDWILNLNKEYNLIWKAKWSAGKVAYILARYTTTWFAVVSK